MSAAATYHYEYGIFFLYMEWHVREFFFGFLCRAFKKCLLDQIMECVLF